MLTSTPFKRENHVFRSPQLQDLMLDALRFFNGTPAYELPPPKRFNGSGVYALYYMGEDPLYEKLGQLNRVAYNHPIYVGKAIPKGGRRGVSTLVDEEPSLVKRLREHARSIELNQKFKGDIIKGAPVLDLRHFACRFMIVPTDEAALISPIEAALIRNYLPLWNSVVDGFGNHDPGSGRYKQAKSAWDVLHPGRKWVVKCQGEPVPVETVITNVKGHLRKLKSED